MSRLVTSVVSLTIFLFSGFAQAQKAEPKRVTSAPEIALWEVAGDYGAVREALEFAITNRGLVVDHVQHIGDMLARTGRDIGSAKPVYSKANALQFCSASISRATMEADPANIAFCPYIVFLYSLPASPDKVYIGYRKPPVGGSPASKAALKQVAELLDGVVQEAISW